MKNISLYNHQGRLNGLVSELALKFQKQPRRAILLKYMAWCLDIRKYMNFPGETQFFYKNISIFSGEPKQYGLCQNTYINFPGKAKRIRTYKNFQESFLKIPHKNTYDFRRKKYYKNNQIFQEIKSYPKNRYYTASSVLCTRGHQAIISHSHKNCLLYTSPSPRDS